MSMSKSAGSMMSPQSATIGEFYLTGSAEWSREDQILWLRLATDCLVLIALDRDIGDTRVVGMVRVRSGVLEFYPSGI